ncbi:MAG: arylamine N-acetyltransferase [Planctomycetes bacterium]|nr:arylamine N-acetyltransferase [Planctomycetota bacterium]
MPLNLVAYLNRIGFEKNLQATPACFEDLHLAHATRIPFENLDILLGRPIRIDLDSIQGKLIQAKRGGYCFEQNLLFATVLESIGLPVTFLAARVRYRVHRVLPRTHVLLLVDVHGSKWIADVGFGTVGLLKPIPLTHGHENSQFGWRYRLIEKSGTWALQSLEREGWMDLYAFTMEPQDLVDLEMANHYVSTFPQSRFVQTLIAQRSTTTERRMLRNLDLIVDRGGETETRTLSDQGELVRVLAEQFDLYFPDATRFRIPALEIS